MARTKKPPPQSAEDIELAKQTITAAFADMVEKRRAALAKAEEEVRRIQLQITDAEIRRAAWIERGEISENSALDAHMFSGQDMRDLAQLMTSPSTRLDPAVVDSARRKRAVTERYLTDRDLLPAALVDSNWRPAR